MDAFTHSLAGVVIARAAFEPSLGKWGVITGVAVALLPDVDFLLKFVNKQLYIKYHRSFANSVFFIIPLSLFWGGMFNWFSGLHNFPAFFTLAFTVLCSHVFFDILNPFGTMIFAPFSNYRFSLDLVYIIDLVFTSLLLFPLIASFIWPDYSRLICLASLACVFLYIGFRFLNHTRARRQNQHYIETNQLSAANFASLPTHLSPFRWHNLIETDQYIYKSGVNTSNRSSHGDYKILPKISYQAPGINSAWIQKALDLPEVKTYLWFARFPVLKYHGFVQNTHRLAFYDYRFEGFKGKLPFVYVVDFFPDGNLSSHYFHRNWDLRTLARDLKKPSVQEY
ncbi:MAG: metal-dependent hydrolase [bacterium]